MTRKLISSGSTFEREYGYSRAVAQSTSAGDWCWVAGTTGYDYAKMVMPEDPSDQARQALKTIEAALAEAGMALTDVVRVRYYLINPELVEAVAPVLAQTFGDTRPATTLVIADLMKPEMLVEIEVDAFKSK